MQFFFYLRPSGIDFEQPGDWVDGLLMIVLLLLLMAPRTGPKAVRGSVQSRFPVLAVEGLGVGSGAGRATRVAATFHASKGKKKEKKGGKKNYNLKKKILRRKNKKKRREK